MKLYIARKTLQIIKDNNVVIAVLCIELCQNTAHVRSLHEIATTRRVAGEDHFDLVTFAFCGLATTVSLAVEAGAGQLCLVVEIWQ